MATIKIRKNVTVRTAEELGRAFGLSAADTAEMEFRSELTVALAKIIQPGQLTHAEIAKSAGTSRTRVTAIAHLPEQTHLAGWVDSILKIGTTRVAMGSLLA